MASRSPWDPWSEVRRLQRELETLFDRSVSRRPAATDEYPPVNVARGEDGGLVDRTTFDVTLVGDSLTIRGERRAEVVADNRCHRRERQVGPFTRTIRLGDRFDPERVDASDRDGIPRISLSRAPAASARKITIEG